IVWQAAQSAASVRYSPRATRATPVGWPGLAVTGSCAAGQKKKEAAPTQASPTALPARMAHLFMRRTQPGEGRGRRQSARRSCCAELAVAERQPPQPLSGGSENGVAQGG